MDMSKLQSFLDYVGGIVWGPYLLIPLLLGTGLYLTFRLGGIQLVRLGAALRLGLIKRSDGDADGDISQFQALTTAMAATVGTGNIVGVATAISIGGPGALFWMWVTALVGMATKFSEVLLSVHFREKTPAGNWVGGAMYFIKNGLGPKWMWLGSCFALFGIVARPPAGAWHPDPSGRHELRWWDGTRWTDAVSDHGQVSADVQ